MVSIKFAANRKSLMKIGKWSLAALSVAFITYFLIQFVILAFAYTMTDTTNTYVNTSLVPDKWTRNGTTETINFTITAGAGPHRIDKINITIPNISSTSINYTVVIGSAGWNGSIWKVGWDYNITISGAVTPQNITFTNTSEAGIEPTGVNYFWFNITPIMLTAEDNHTQAWVITTVDNLTIQNVTTLYTFVDSKTPDVDYLYYPKNYSYISGNSSEPFVIKVNELNLKNATLQWREYGTSGWPNNQTMSCTGTAPTYTCKVNVVGLNTYAEGIIEYYYQTYDDVGNSATNGTSSQPLRTTIDRTAPKWSNNVSNVASNTEYSIDKNYGFQIDWTEANKISNVTIEHDFSGTATNYSATQKTSTTFYYNTTGIAAGTYSYRWFANDSVIFENGNWNVTTPVVYVVAKNTTVENSLILGFNGTANAAKTYVYGEVINITANKTISEGNITLWRNTTEISKEQTSITEELTLANATWNYTLYYNASQNYTSDSITFNVLVNKGDTSLTYYINDTLATSNTNKVIGSGQGVNITVVANNSQGSIYLFRDGGDAVNVTSGNAALYNETVYSGVPGQQWNITGFYNGSQNYSASSTIWNYVIIESVAPKWSSLLVNYTNNTVVGTTMILNISAVWNDSVNSINSLDKWWISSNETVLNGLNSSAYKFSVLNNSWYNLSVSGFGANVTFWIKIYANDTSANENVTDRLMFRVDGTIPTLNTTTPATGSAITGISTQLFQVYAYDETLNSTNVTLHWRSTGAPAYNDTGFLTCYNQSYMPVSIGSSPALFICNTTINLAGRADGTVIQYYFTASDNSSLPGMTGSSAVPLTTTINRNPPQFFSVAENITTANNVKGKYDGINISVYWTDDTGLNYATLETNESGVWTNKTTIYGSSLLLSGTTATVNFNWTNSTVGNGVTVGFRVFTNDTAGNENVSTVVNITIDNTKPTPIGIAANVTNATTIKRGTIIGITANWTDDVALGHWWIWYNESSIEGTNKTWTAFTASNYSNASTSIDTTSFTRGMTFNVSVYANDTSANENITETWQWTIDGTAPNYGNITSGNSVSVNSTEYVYNPGTTYFFNISWTDNVALSTVLFEWNGANETASEASSEGSTHNYTARKTDLALTNYTFRWFANDSSSNEASTALWNFNITKNTTIDFVGLMLNGTESNVSYVYPQAVNATGWRNFTEIGNLSLWRNGVIVASSLDAQSVSEHALLGNGSYNYSLTFSATNYTDKNVTVDRFALVNRGIANITLWINNAEGNNSVQKGVSANFTAVINTTYNVLFKIAFNLTAVNTWEYVTATARSISNVTSTSGLTAADYYNITAYFEGDQNFTADSQTYWLNITSDTTAPAVLIYDYTNLTFKKTGASLTLNISVADAGVGVTDTQCNVTVGGVATQNITYVGTSSSGWCNGTLTIGSTSEGQNLINVTVNDAASPQNLGKNDTLYVIVDNTPPVLVITRPLNATYNKTASGKVWINGTAYDNLGIGAYNFSISGNATMFSAANLIYTGANNTEFGFWNTSAVSDGYVLLSINISDNATNIQNVSVYFWKDDVAPQVVVGWTNSTNGTYQSSSSQTVQVRVVDNLQTNDSITLYYAINISDCGDTSKWFSIPMSGTRGTSTTYSATINTIANNSGYCTRNGKEYVPYYITGVDNATNSISIGGSISAYLANITIDESCGNSGKALAYCSYPTYPMSAVNNYNEVRWSTYQLTGATSLSSNYNISNVLNSINNRFSFVQYHNISSTTTPWISYDPTQAWYLNTLRFANNTNTEYNINATAAGVVIRIS